MAFTNKRASLRSCLDAAVCARNISRMEQQFQVSPPDSPTSGRSPAHVTMGEMLSTMETDLDQSELIVIWGANPATDSPPLAHLQILQARQRGAEVIAIDPRRAETAVESGAEWVPIRPGTDGALALGMINVLVEEELY